MISTFSPSFLDFHRSLWFSSLYVLFRPYAYYLFSCILSTCSALLHYLLAMIRFYPSCFLFRNHGVRLTASLTSSSILCRCPFSFLIAPLVFLRIALLHPISLSMFFVLCLRTCVFVRISRTCFQFTMAFWQVLFSHVPFHTHVCSIMPSLFVYSHFHITTLALSITYTQVHSSPIPFPTLAQFSLFCI